MCPYCDAEHLFYDREALIDSSFRHIPSTFILNEDGKMEQTSKLIIFLLNLQLSQSSQVMVLNLPFIIIECGLT